MSRPQNIRVGRVTGHETFSFFGLKWGQGQIFKFCNNSDSKLSIYFEISHADRGTINMKHIKHDFLSKACVSTPGWTWGWGQRVKIQLFQNIVMLHIN